LHDFHKVEKWLWRKSDFFHHFIDIKKYEGDPLFPPEGEATQGVYPLDPLLAIWLTLCEIIECGGIAEAPKNIMISILLQQFYRAVYTLMF
jgi:hypothetical protein